MKRHWKLAALIVATVALPLLVQQRGEVRVRKLQTVLTDQTAQLSFLASENRRFSNTLGQAKEDQLSDKEVAELSRLRNEARHLRETLEQGEKLQRESSRIRKALQETSADDEAENPTALLSEEMEVRQRRVADLTKWLDENPRERIPELQYVSEMSWIRSADRNRVTDEDFQLWMSVERGNAESRFGRMAYEALKAYGKANDGQFPTELSQLEPFFSSPVEKAILERYHIVSAKTLPKFLAEAGGDWIITQKAPINPKFDSRMAISLKDRRATVQEGRWDPVSEIKEPQTAGD